jgi:hypothetical protein
MIERVIPTIGNLAKTIDAQNLKTLNKQVLLLTRSESANTRWAALSVIKEFYEKLGEEMLVLFPETIPFLAELLEDQDSQVEELCKDVCLEIQQFLGEPIDQYFTA